MNLERKVLIATDASKYASEIIDAIASCTCQNDCEMHLLTVVEKTHIWDSHEQYEHQCKQIQEGHLSKLQKVLAQCRISGECLEGSASDVILKKAEEEDFDLIIIGSHGDTGVRLEHVGSIAAAIVNRAPCSVSVIKVGRNEGKNSESAAKLASSSHV